MCRLTALGGSLAGSIVLSIQTYIHIGLGVSVGKASASQFNDGHFPNGCLTADWLMLQYSVKVSFKMKYIT